MAGLLRCGGLPLHGQGKRTRSGSVSQQTGQDVLGACCQFIFAVTDARACQASRRVVPATCTPTACRVPETRGVLERGDWVCVSRDKVTVATQSDVWLLALLRRTCNEHELLFIHQIRDRALLLPGCPTTRKYRRQKAIEIWNERR